jgi:AAA ATPase domain
LKGKPQAMMKYLFMDNYRGFSNAFVPLLDVNFLVGENSTGKTSVLSLLKILSSPNFFMGAMFGGGEEVLFGHFNEVVSAHAKDRSFFSVGMVEERQIPGEKGLQIVGMLATFRDHSGIPKISRLTFGVGKDSVTIGISNDHLLYKEAAISISKSKSFNSEDMKALVEKWSFDHAKKGSEWKEMDLPKRMQHVHQAPLFALLHMVADKLKNRNIYFPIMFNDFASQLIWIAPIRTETKRTYDEPNTAFSSEGSHTPYLIRKMTTGPNARKFQQFMEKVGKASGLFQGIEIKKFGDGDDAPFEVDAVLDDMALNLRLLGYGVSQSLPILVELLDRRDGAWFAIQQPEVHLHPRAQAALGDVFFEMADTGKKRFVIETHSDFTIDRFRKNYRDRKTSKAKLPDSHILFFERRERHNTVVSLPIGSNGDLPVDQPDGYREFFLNEQIDLLEL